VTRLIEFFVPGVPVAQGSKTMGQTKDGRAFMRESSATSLTPWRRAIRTEAHKHHVSWMRQTDLAIRLAFTFPLNKGETMARWKPTKPDIDKLGRAVLDGLAQGKVLVDDAQVVALTMTKVHGRWPGVAVQVSDATNIARPQATVLDEFEQMLLDVQSGRLTIDQAVDLHRSLISSY